MKIGIIVGSLREDSWNGKVADIVKELFPADVEAEIIDIKNVPFYNEDWDKDGEEHEEYVRVRDAIRDKDGFVFVTPEYNRSYAPAIKNILDIGSRDKSGNLWAGKVAAVFSASQGGFGGMAANHALRNSFIFLDIVPIQQPEIYLARVQNYFEDGVINPKTEELLQIGVDTLVERIKQLQK